jgi:hypothetical protein
VGLLGWYAASAALGALLFAFAHRIRAPIVGTLLLLCGAGIFAVRLVHEGPYAFPRGVDLAFGSLDLVLGALLTRPGRLLPRGGAPWRTRLLLALAPVALFGGLAAILHEAEEVVVLRTTDERGAVHETRLWVVDHLGSPWVVTSRSGPHVAHLTRNPRVALVRHGVAACQVAEVHGDRETVVAHFRLREEKYFAHRLAVALGIWSRSLEGIEAGAVAIRLRPCPPGEPPGAG